MKEVQIHEVNAKDYKKEIRRLKNALEKKEDWWQLEYDEMKTRFETLKRMTTETENEQAEEIQSLKYQLELKEQAAQDLRPTPRTPRVASKY